MAKICKNVFGLCFEDTPEADMDPMSQPEKVQFSKLSFYFVWFVCLYFNILFSMGPKDVKRCPKNCLELKNC